MPKRQRDITYFWGIHLTGVGRRLGQWNVPSRRDNADIRPHWRDLRRAARGGKSRTPVKWTPQCALIALAIEGLVGRQSHAPGLDSGGSAFCHFRHRVEAGLCRRADDRLGPVVRAAAECAAHFRPTHRRLAPAPPSAANAISAKIRAGAQGRFAHTCRVRTRAHTQGQVRAHTWGGLSEAQPAMRGTTRRIALRASALRRPTRQRVMRLDQALQPLRQHMRVNLRRRDVRVSQQQLQAAQVRSMRQQMRGEGMPQHMG